MERHFFNDKSSWMLIMVLASVLALAGCAVGPDYGRPTPAAPTAYTHSTDAVTNPPTATLDQWWKVFHDPELDALIGEMREANLDLRLARARVREARALRGVTRCALFPQVNGDGGHQKAVRSENQ